MCTPFRPASSAEYLPEYYQDFDDADIAAAVRNFDDEGTFELFERETRSPTSRNFFIDFGDDDAWCGFDLEVNSISRLLRAERPSNLHTRWINIWLPSEQKETIHALAKHYDFSPRLLATMCSDPVPRKSRPLETKSSSTFRSRRSNRQMGSERSSKETALYSEESIGMTELMQSTQMDLVRDLSHYHIVNDVWHWSSVDWGRRYTCLGYNSLHNLQANPAGTGHHDDHPQDLPHAQRVWNWLLLCEEQTVISISEDPFPFNNGHLNASELKTLYMTRRNLVNVFRQLSKTKNACRESSVITLPLRHRIGDSEEETAHRPSDTPGLLFYYLFEDWYSTYSLVARREHQYAAELDKLRKEMLIKAELAHVDRLHHIGCQLSVLKRVYRSYELIIERILKKQEATLASLKNSHIVSGPDSLASSAIQPMSAGRGGIPQVPEEESLLGVSLSSAARARFERLKDRIFLYALSEIEECLGQKESLVMMNFNLIAIKESFAVERLTRITLLLGKITILFMPVSLMTAYFSVQFANVQFTLKEYWIWFGVIMGVSIAALFFFSFFSGTMEGRLIYRPLSRMLYDVSVGYLTRRKTKMV